MKRKLLVAILSILLVALLIAITPASFVRARSVAQQNACVNNLRQLNGGKQRWQLENRKTTNDIPTFADVAPYLKLPLVCPQGGTYIVGRVGEPPKCSIGGRHALP
jgi:hypothetical protein